MMSTLHLVVIGAVKVTARVPVAAARGCAWRLAEWAAVTMVRAGAFSRRLASLGPGGRGAARTVRQNPKFWETDRNCVGKCDAEPPRALDRDKATFARCGPSGLRHA